MITTSRWTSSSTTVPNAWDVAVLRTAATLPGTALVTAQVRSSQQLQPLNSALLQPLDASLLQSLAAPGPLLEPLHDPLLQPLDALLLQPVDAPQLASYSLPPPQLSQSLALKALLLCLPIGLCHFMLQYNIPGTVRARLTGYPGTRADINGCTSGYNTCRQFR
jgi:hypothetical protein